jgi:hypothetical protein
MAKGPNPRQIFPDLPPAPEPYPGSERFGDWDLDNIVPIDPGEKLVNDDPEGDPNKLVDYGEDNGEEAPDSEQPEPEQT